MNRSVKGVSMLGAVMAATMAVNAEAVMLDPRGIGQVLLYPYYSAQVWQFSSAPPTRDH